MKKSNDSAQSVRCRVIAFWLCRNSFAGLAQSDSQQGQNATTRPFGKASANCAEQLQKYSNMELKNENAMKILKHIYAFAILVITLALITPSLALAQDKTITLAVGRSMVPYYIPEIESGIELDIVREAMALKGYRIVFRYLTPVQWLRDIELLKRTVDGVLTVSGLSRIAASYSNVHIIFENIAISLQKNNFTIFSIDNLMDKSVMAFQGAATYLGDEFAAMAEANPRYQEIVNHEELVSLLFSGHADVIVIDKRIFRFYQRHFKYSNRIRRMAANQEVTTHDLFLPTPYKVAFLDEKVRDDFNAGLDELRRSGRYERIIRKYTTR